MNTPGSNTFGQHDGAEDLGHLVDLALYPLDRLREESGQALVRRCREALETVGCVVLPGFVPAASLGVMTDEARALAPRAYFNDIRTNPYTSAEDPTLPADHPIRTFNVRTNGFVGGDLMDPAGAIQRFYRQPALVAFLAACMGLDRLFHYADPIACAVVNVLRPGAQFPWHFDNNDYTITVLSQTPEAGGVFEFCPNIRSASDQNFAAVRAVLQGDRRPVRQLHLRPGDLQIFLGRNALHRVTPVEGALERHSLIFSFVEDPHRIGGAERTRRIYGRLHDLHRAADAAAKMRDAL